MRAFIAKRDMASIAKWLSKRDDQPLIEKNLPRFGMIVEDVAVGFICLTDSSACFLEGFITNPDADPEDRHKALCQISSWLLGVASSAGYKRCIVLSSEKSIHSRAIDLGFEESKLKVLVKDF